jgi:hypothetical protein
MRTIWKFQLTTTDLQHVQMPKGPILFVAAQREVPCLWVEVDSEAPRIERLFAIYGTGHQMPEGINQDYLGSYMLMEGALVFHVYELIMAADSAMSKTINLESGELPHVLA